MTSDDKKARLRNLVKQAHHEELENIKRSRRNARKPADANLEPYRNDAFLQLMREIDSL